MIKRLRKKFIIVTTCSVLAVLILIVGIINIVNYSNVIKNADQIVMLLKDGGGTFGYGNNGENILPDGDLNFKPRRPMSPETPFETRFFTVVLGNDGTVKIINTDKIASVNKTQAVDYAISLFNKNKHTGFYDNYRY